MICEFIDQLRSEGHAVESICRSLRKAGLQIAARTYREWTSPQRVVAARTVSDAEVEDVIRNLVWQPDGQGRRKMQPAGLYGRRKMLAEVHRAGLPSASPGAVDRVMRTLGLSGVVRSKKVYTTVADPDVVRAPDLVDRDFTSDRPDRLWVADFTYVRTWAGFTYVAFIVDVFAQRIVAWNAATTMVTDLVMTPLRMALWQRDREGHPIEPKSLVSHSDAGSQYTSVAFTDRLALEGIDPSIGSVGDAYDNALMETINGLYKAECIRSSTFRDGPDKTVSDARVRHRRVGRVVRAMNGSPRAWDTFRPSSSSRVTTPLSTESCNPHRERRETWGGSIMDRIVHNTLWIDTGTHNMREHAAANH